MCRLVLRIWICSCLLLAVCCHGEKRRRNRHFHEHFRTRIVGGRQIHIQAVPYQVQLAFGGSLICGGSIVTRRHVVSAAHCFDNPSIRGSFKKFLRIRAGADQVNMGTSFRVSAITIHPEYKVGAFDNDIVLLLIEDTFDFSNSNQASIPLSRATDTHIFNKTALVTGFGRLAEDGKFSSNLQSVFVQVFNQEMCPVEYQLGPHQICAGIMDGGQDSCEGDSGGPLVMNGGLLGVVSFGQGCARAGKPGVYTKIPAFIPWLIKNIKIHN